MKKSGLEELTSLVQFLSNKRIGKIRLFFNQNEGTKEARLFKAILSGNILSDEEACVYLYGSKKYKNNYRQLKYSLREKLLNTFFFIDTSGPEFTERRKAFHSISKSYVQFRILANNFGRSIGIPFAEKTLKKALKFEFYVYADLLVQELVNHYAIIEINQSKFEKYCKLSEEVSIIIEAERLAKKYYALASNMNFVRKAKDLDDYNEKLMNWCNHLDSLSQNVNSQGFNFYYTDLKIHQLALEEKYLEGLHFIDEKDFLFKAKKNTSKFWDYISNMNRAIFLINLKRIKEAIEILKSIDYVRKGYHKWYKVKNLTFICYLLQEEYKKAHFLSIEVLKTIKVKSNKQFFELWSIKYAYMYFLKKVRNETEDSEDENFRLNKFLNEVPIYSKNKHGMNASILIIQMLFFLLYSKIDNYLDRVDSLKQYVYRYLGSSENKRVNNFIRILIKIPKANFNLISLQRKAGKNIEAIKSSPLRISQQISEIEIIPFDQLLEILFELLENTKVKQKRKPRINH